MKHIYMLMMALLTAIVSFTACSVDNDPFITADENAEPRILNTDIEEAKGGKPSALPTISRDANFVFEVTVTPALYTTVYWYIDGEEVCQGTKIDLPILAGDHDVKIVARTTMGKEAVRNCSLKVLALEGDPVLNSAEKNLYCQTGTTKTIEGANLAGIEKVIIGGQEVAASSTDATLTFVVPELEDGAYHLTAVAADGMKYGCNKVNVSHDKWVEPGVEEVTLWSGNCDVNWGDSNVLVDMTDVPEGAPVKIYYTMNDGAEYYNFRITTPWWGDNESDNVVPQMDLTDETPNPYVFEYSTANKAICDERGGMLIVGFGFTVSKVTYEKRVAATENVLWEGNEDINWGDNNVTIDMTDVPVGAKVLYYYTMNAGAEYYNFRVTTPWWGDNESDNVVPQMDLTDETPNPYVSEFTEANKAICDERGGMLIVGFGFHLNKVAWTK